MGAWARTGEQFLAMLSLSKEERSLGVPRGKKSFPCRLLKASTLRLPMRLKRLSGSVSLSSNSLVFILRRHLFSATINLLSHSQRSTSTTHALNISMFDSTLSVGSLKMENYDSFIALPTKWLRMSLQKRWCLRKSSTLLVSWVLWHLEECWNGGPKGITLVWTTVP